MGWLRPQPRERWDEVHFSLKYLAPWPSSLASGHLRVEGSLVGGRWLWGRGEEGGLERGPFATVDELLASEAQFLSKATTRAAGPPRRGALRVRRQSVSGGREALRSCQLGAEKCFQRHVRRAARAGVDI